MKPPLTRKEALEKTRDHWLWLSKNPGKDKEDYPEVELGVYPVHHCFCCQYVHEQVKLPVDAFDSWPAMICAIDDLNSEVGLLKAGLKVRRKCPLYNFWPKGCCDKKSPYIKWCRSRETSYALEIVKACDIELEKLENETPNI